VDFHPKIKIEILVSDQQAGLARRPSSPPPRPAASATGKLFVLPVGRMAVRIRTGEPGESAL
jgi:nitrogen regulatory protein PII